MWRPVNLSEQAGEGRIGHGNAGSQVRVSGFTAFGSTSLKERVLKGYRVSAPRSARYRLRQNFLLNRHASGLGATGAPADSRLLPSPTLRRQGLRHAVSTNILWVGEKIFFPLIILFGEKYLFPYNMFGGYFSPTICFTSCSQAAQMQKLAVQVGRGPEDRKRSKLSGA